MDIQSLAASIWLTVRPHLLVWANGVLAISYWTWEQAALLISLACGLGVLLSYDRAVQRTAGDRLLRYARGTRVHASYRPQLESALTLLVWAVASLLSAAPIPAIGAAMWLAFLAALKAIPQEREGLLFRQKTMLAGYGLLVIALRLALSYSPDAGQLVAMLNTGGDYGQAAGLFESVRAGLLPYVMLVIWVMYPLGYFAVIVQRLPINRTGILKPGGSAEAYINDLRSRGEA